MSAIARLAFDRLLCNCTNFPIVGNVMITPSGGLIAREMQNLDIIALVDEYVDLDDEEKEESGDGNDNNGDETKTEMEQLYTQLIQLKGSSFHATFQNNLKQYKERLIEKQSVNVRLHFKPANVRDKNAIVVHVNLSTGDEGWQPIGYIPTVKVPKMTVALRKREFKLVTLRSVFYQFIMNIGEKRYFPAISVTKVGKWPPINIMTKYTCRWKIVGKRHIYLMQNNLKE